VNEPQASLLVVEDDPELAAMLGELLGAVYRVDTAPSAEAALQLALRGRYEAMVVDRRLPGMDGVGFVQALRRAGIPTPVLMLTALGTVGDRVSGLDGGANDYLVKPFDAAELLARLRALRRGFTAERRRIEIGDWTFVPETRTVLSPTGLRILLTETESALLGYLADSPERVRSREEILAAVFAAGESPGTVDAYVHYLRRKTSREIVETVRQQGYRIGAPA